jgi:hypothetical protein
MHSQAAYENNGRSLAAIVNELKLEVSDFLRTRYQMLMAEINEKVTAWKTGIPLLVVALVLALVAFLVLTGAIVAALVPVVGVVWALVIVGGGYLLLGAIIGWIGYAEISANPLKPERTMRILKEDQVWIQSEARSA